MKLCGLTGGVGMGKSTAASILRQRGLPVTDADDLSRQVVLPDRPALEEIRRAFGPDILNSDGSLCREKLGRIVFSNPSSRRILEEITHPRIRDCWLRQIHEWRESNFSLGVVVIPLLFETGAQAELDATICIACSAATQQTRLASRGWSSEDIAGRLAAQWPVDRKIERSDFTVWSEGTLEILAAQLDRVVSRVTQPIEPGGTAPVRREWPSFFVSI